MNTIGVFDSGVGGLSVLREIRAQLPAARLLYFADSAHVPYGSRSLDEVRGFSLAIADFLLAQGAEATVVACNTASAAALLALRERLAVPVVGMEPAVKPAVEHSHSGVVAVLATAATFQGALFAAVVERFAHGVEVIPQVCPGLVEQIERGELDTLATEALLRSCLEPLLGRGIDALVLGCTHYPFVRPLIERICGPGVRVIDPSAAVARQVRRVLSVVDGAADGGGSTIYYTSGDAAQFNHALQALGCSAGEVMAARWLDDARIVTLHEG